MVAEFDEKTMKRLRRTDNRRRRSGMAMLLCVFIAGVTAMLLLGILQTESIQLTAVANTIHYERALLLADAGVHDALARIESTPGWTGTVPITQLPPASGYTYQATVTAVGGGNMLIFATGSSGGITHTQTLTVASAVPDPQP